MSSSINKNNSTKKFNYPSSVLKGPKGSTIISNGKGEDEEYEMTIKNLLESIKSNETMMEKLSETEIVERMRNAFKLAEQEQQIEREGENSENTVAENGSYENTAENTVSNLNFLITTNKSLEQSTTTRSSFPNPYENSNMEYSTPSTGTVNQKTHSSTNLPKNYNNINEGMIYDSSLITNLQNSTTESINEPLVTSETSYQEIHFSSESTTTATTYSVNPQTAYTPNPLAVNSFPNPYRNTVIEENRSDLFNMHENIIFIETLEDEQKCIGDPGEPGSDRFDGVDGNPGLNGLPRDDGEKATFWDICNF